MVEKFVIMRAALDKSSAPSESQSTEPHSIPSKQMTSPYRNLLELLIYLNWFFFFFSVGKFLPQTLSLLAL